MDADTKNDARQLVLDFFSTLISEWDDCPDPPGCPHHAGIDEGHIKWECDRLATTLLSALTDNGFVIATEVKDMSPEPGRLFVAREASY